MRLTARAALSSQVERDAGKELGVFKNITPLSIPTSVHANALRIKNKTKQKKTTMKNTFTFHSCLFTTLLLGTLKKTALLKRIPFSYEGRPQSM